MPETKKCPYCGNQMEDGCLYAPADHAIYWRPREKDSSAVVLTEKTIKNDGGFVLGEATKIGFFAKNRPASHFCRKCGIIITEIEKNGEHS